MSAVADPVAAAPADPAAAAAAPAAGWESGPLGVVQAAEREMGRLVAVQATAVAEFAEARPASVDRPQGQRGAMSAERGAGRPELLRAVSEWASPELAVALSCTERSAGLPLERSLTRCTGCREPPRRCGTVAAPRAAVGAPGPGGTGRR
ncbi:hypothetical protein ACI8AC_13235 [Geodermatophilus sp. SYSU D00758]